MTWREQIRFKCHFGVDIRVIALHAKRCKFVELEEKVNSKFGTKGVKLKYKVSRGVRMGVADSCC